MINIFVSMQDLLVVRGLKTLMLEVANLANQYKMMQKMAETLAQGYSSKSTQLELYSIISSCIEDRISS